MFRMILPGRPVADSDRYHGSLADLIDDSFKLMSKPLRIQRRGSHTSLRGTLSLPKSGFPAIPAWPARRT